MSEEPGRRRDSAATKAALLTAARTLFADRGFEQTTVRDIAARAGVNQALLFRYFGSKEALFHAAMASTSEQLHRPDPAGAARWPGCWRGCCRTGRAQPTDSPIYAFLRSSTHGQSAQMLRDELGARYRRCWPR